MPRLSRTPQPEQLPGDIVRLPSLPGHLSYMSTSACSRSSRYTCPQYPYAMPKPQVFLYPYKGSYLSSPIRRRYHRSVRRSSGRQERFCYIFGLSPSVVTVHTWWKEYAYPSTLKYCTHHSSSDSYFMYFMEMKRKSPQHMLQVIIFQNTLDRCHLVTTIHVSMRSSVHSCLLPHLSSQFFLLELCTKYLSYCMCTTATTMDRYTLNPANNMLIVNQNITSAWKKEP